MKSRPPELGHFLPLLKLDFGQKHIKVKGEREKEREEMDKPDFLRSYSA